MPKWQFNFQNWNENNAYGPLLTGVRQNARGKWLHPTEAPKRLLQYLSVEPTGPGSTNFCCLIHGDTKALRKQFDDASAGMTTKVKWQLDNEAGIRGTVEIYEPEDAEVRAILAKALNPDPHTKRMMMGLPEKHSGEVQIPSRRNGHGEIVNTYEARVDLKWSLWSVDQSTWEEYAPGVWDWMRAWFDASLDDGDPESPGLADSPRVVHSACWKEIRFGRVEIQPGSAKVHFWAEYDEDSDEEAPDIVEEIEAETFEELMTLIDGVEERLINDEA